MFALFDDAGKFLAGRVMSEADSSMQIELDSGKRVKVKSANVLIKFAKPSPAEMGFVDCKEAGRRLCINCADKPKYGGLGVRKQGCVVATAKRDAAFAKLQSEVADTTRSVVE